MSAAGKIADAEIASQAMRLHDDLSASADGEPAYVVIVAALMVAVDAAIDGEESEEELLRLARNLYRVRRHGVPS